MTRGSLHRIAAAGLCSLALTTSACGLPLDPEGTLDRVEGGTLRVGVIPSAPWTVPEGGGRGVEVELVRRFAADVDARIRWSWGPPEDLLGALEHRAVDMVTGGSSTPTPPCRRWG